MNNITRVGVESLVQAYFALGLPKKAEVDVADVTPWAIARKISNPKLLESMGVEKFLVDACHDAEMTANLLDAFSETGSIGFLYFADDKYQNFLASLPIALRTNIELITASAISYFKKEQYYAERIKRKDQITLNEAIAYHLARGADSQIYAELAQASETTPKYTGLVAGFQIYQALWDLEDDIRDISDDIKNLGVNILLMAGLHKRRGLNNLLKNFYRQSCKLDIPPVLKTAIREEYNSTKRYLNLQYNEEDIEDMIIEITLS